jgi:putative ABC transport system permease protein
MWQLALKQLLGHKTKTFLSVTCIAFSAALIASLYSMGQSYERELKKELSATGVQIMLVPLGCPYDAAVHVLKGKALEMTLPESALLAVRSDSAVAVASPVLLVSQSSAGNAAVETWTGIDESSLSIRPWWKVTSGKGWFARTNEVILGAEAASAEERSVGDRIYCSPAGKSMIVAGILAKSGVSDDAQSFISLPLLQEMTGLKGRISAIHIRMKDSGDLSAVTRRLQEIPGAQVVTLTEMLGTFSNLIKAARAFLFGIASMAFAASAVGLSVAMLTVFWNQQRDLTVFRCLGATRTSIVTIFLYQSIWLSLIGALLGIALLYGISPMLHGLLKNTVPFMSGNGFAHPDLKLVGIIFGMSLASGLIATVYPAVKAGRIDSSFLKPAF